jgi:hypothetical protein
MRRKFTRRLVSNAGIVLPTAFLLEPKRDDCGVLLAGRPRASGFAVDSGHRQLGLTGDIRKI